MEKETGRSLRPFSSSCKSCYWGPPQQILLPKCFPLLPFPNLSLVTKKEREKKKRESEKCKGKKRERKPGIKFVSQITLWPSFLPAQPWTEERGTKERTAKKGMEKNPQRCFEGMLSMAARRTLSFFFFFCLSPVQSTHQLGLGAPRSLVLFWVAQPPREQKWQNEVANVKARHFSFISSFIARIHKFSVNAFPYNVFFGKHDVPPLPQDLPRISLSFLLLLVVGVSHPAGGVLLPGEGRHGLLLHESDPPHLVDTGGEGALSGLQGGQVVLCQEEQQQAKWEELDGRGGETEKNVLILLQRSTTGAWRGKTAITRRRRRVSHLTHWISQSWWPPSLAETSGVELRCCLGNCCNDPNLFNVGCKWCRNRLWVFHLLYSCLYAHNWSCMYRTLFAFPTNNDRR